MGAVVRVLQKFINVKVPVPGGLLVRPACAESYNDQCIKSYPDFGGTFSDRSCGLASIQPAHTLNPKTCTQRRADGLPVNCKSYGSE